jgi:hypothetical protein
VAKSVTVCRILTTKQGTIVIKGSLLPPRTHIAHSLSTFVGYSLFQFDHRAWLAAWMGMAPAGVVAGPRDLA